MDYLTSAEQVIPDQLAKAKILGESEVPVSLGIKSWFDDVELITPFCACSLFFKNTKSKESRRKEIRKN